MFPGSKLAVQEEPTALLGGWEATGPSSQHLGPSSPVFLPLWASGWALISDPSCLPPTCSPDLTQPSLPNTAKQPPSPYRGFLRAEQRGDWVVGPATLRQRQPHPGSFLQACRVLPSYTEAHRIGGVSVPST